MRVLTPTGRIQLSGCRARPEPPLPQLPPAYRGPTSPAPGTCTGVMYGKPSSRRTPSTRGCSGTGSDSQEPSVTCSMASSDTAATSTTPPWHTSVSARQQAPPGTVLQSQSSGGQGKAPSPQESGKPRAGG